jgi:hypothetical protein
LVSKYVFEEVLDDNIQYLSKYVSYALEITFAEDSQELSYEYRDHLQSGPVLDSTLLSLITYIEFINGQCCILSCPLADEVDVYLNSLEKSQVNHPLKLYKHSFCRQHIYTIDYNSTEILSGIEILSLSNMFLLDSDDNLVIH